MTGSDRRAVYCGHMRILVGWFTLAAAFGAPLRLSFSGFAPGPDGTPEGWTVWAPRPDIAPRAFVDPVHSRGASGSLALAGNSNPGVFGGWEREITGIEAGKWYRLVAHYRAAGLRYEPRQVAARLDWLTAAGKRTGQPDYAYQTRPEADWIRLKLEAPAPPGAAVVKLQLLLVNAPAATVWWDEIEFEEIPAPAPRRVVVAAVNFRPSKSGSSEENVRRFLEVVDRAVPDKADVILLPEGITVVGTGMKYADVAEPVPGPTTALLAEAARKKGAYVVAGIYEREGKILYNTAVLLDRRGNLVGKYRKVYLPREEMEGGLTPGDDYPVFATDFGRLGVMICWDVQYADPARALALKGAELVLVPIWGGNEELGKARAIENQVFVATSGYDYPTYIMDPAGEVIAQAREQGSAAVATIDLNRRYVDPWLGHMRGRFFKELRLDVPVERPWIYRVE